MPGLQIRGGLGASPQEASDILKSRFKWKHLLNNVPGYFCTDFGGRARLCFY